MFSNKLEICGIINKETIKESDDKVFLTLNTIIGENDKSKSLIYLEVEKELWDSVNINYYILPLVITGEIQARRTKSNSPFIYMKVSSIVLKSRKDREIKQINKYKSKIGHVEKLTKTKVNWVHAFKTAEPEEKLHIIDISKIYLKEDLHMQCALNFSAKSYINPEEERIKTPALVKIEDDGRYSLVIGFKEYLHCKLLNTDMKTYVTNLSLDDFLDKYNIRSKKYEEHLENEKAEQEKLAKQQEQNNQQDNQQDNQDNQDN